MRKINIFDTTLRDGEQSPGINLNFSEKMEIAKQLERLGVDIIEAGFPSSSPGDFKSVKAISESIKGCSITGLSRTNRQDIDTTWDALKNSEEPRLHVFLATSPIHMTYKLKQTPDQVIENSVDAVKYAASRFPHIEWSAEDATRSDLDFLIRIVTQVIDAGATVINLPDTVGYTTPEEYGRMFSEIRQHVPNIDRVTLSAHCHDDLGMAVANSLAAIENGVDQIEGCINGIGERAGNASLEEIAVALRIRGDFYQAETGLNLQEIKRTSALISKLTGVMIPPNKAVVGDNAFAHEAGIHQDGVLKEKTTYEIISPELVGTASNRLVLGKHSGRHAFKDKMSALGYELTDDECKKVFKAFKELADKKKNITDEDLFALMTEERASAEEKGYEVVDVQVQYGTNNIPTATMTLKTPEGDVIQEAATGSGSVEAIYNTIERMVSLPVHLDDYRIQSVGEGRDALADVYVKVTIDQVEGSGRGTAQDVLEASAKAYTNAVNRVAKLHSSHREFAGQS
ncbi:MAG TPA: 2-isopropylmalate synthase [Bacillales bacterium]|nr:2-isopropylmalate synthase [Bacillales bacterium]